MRAAAVTASQTEPLPAYEKKKDPLYAAGMRGILPYTAGSFISDALNQRLSLSTNSSEMMAMIP